MEPMSTPDELSRILSPVFKSYDVKRAVLFGSCAKGTAGTKSDIDILVDSGLRGLRFLSLYEDIHRTLGREIDLFDVAHIDKNSKIDMEISVTGVVIHER